MIIYPPSSEVGIIIDFPHSIYDVYEKLLSIGIRKSPNEIMLTDNEDDDIQVKLYSDSDFGNHVIRILGENNSLADANTTAYLLMTADDELKDELEQNILYDQYDSIQELTADIKKMKLVYIYLHDRMDKEKKAWPGLNSIAKDLSLSRSTVKRAVKDLEKAGLIRKEPHYRENGSATSNRYYLL